MAESPVSDPALPSELPVLPLRRTVVFPMTAQPLGVARAVAIESVQRALQADRMVLLVMQEGDDEDPSLDQLRRIGTVGVIRQMAKGPAGLQILVDGFARVRVDDYHRDGNWLRATISAAPEAAERNIEVEAHARRVRELIDKAVSLASGISPDLRGLLIGEENPLRLAYLLGTLLDMKPEDKQALLEADQLTAKLNAVAAALSREISLLELKGKIESQAQKEMTDAQREYYLRQQLKAIQEELGENESRESQDLHQRIEQANLPEHVKTAALREVERIERMPQASPEYQMLRTYIDWVLEVPWARITPDRLDPVEARRVLDEDHYDLDKVKDRIVEYLAVRKLKGDMKGPILCFVGPPGVGKTSLGQSIARAMNRRFVRISLGGVRDEAEIRGHRRTYIGALPGRIVQGMKQAGSANPVFMLDEVDKVQPGGFSGDPASALLEVLDPAQNNTFRDHYLELPLDLSHVLFIATANQLGTVQPALLDRMEIIPLAGYTEEEKLHIARQYLVPRQLREHGLTGDLLAFDDAGVRRVIAEYTREAGVRNLERQIGTVARKVAARVATSLPSSPVVPPVSDAAPAPPPDLSTAPAVPVIAEKFVVGADDLPQYLGPPRFKPDVAFRTSRPGVATGVAWTETGGDVLYIEASLLPAGKGNITLTGQLGSVMQESARAAVSHIRSQAEALGVPANFLDTHDLHVHVPAGAIPKDGPSAGVTMAAAILSALRRQPVRSDVAMTGEITLSGLVLPVGGIREKALAARRQGIRTFILPEQNTADLSELPEELKAGMTFVPASTLDDVLRVAFGDTLPPVPAGAPATEGIVPTPAGVSARPGA
jgi:endopeptidase La